MSVSSPHFAAISAFTLWGLFPLYWKYFSEVSAWDLFGHRLIWSFLTVMGILFYQKKTQNLKFKKNHDRETLKQFRKKHKDKATYRMLKDEEKNVS